MIFSFSPRHAVRDRPAQSGIHIRCRAQIEHAAGKHVARVIVPGIFPRSGRIGRGGIDRLERRLGAVDHFVMDAQQRQRLVARPSRPCGIADFDRSIAVVVAGDFPFHADGAQGRGIDHQLAGRDGRLRLDRSRQQQPHSHANPETSRMSRPLLLPDLTRKRLFVQTRLGRYACGNDRRRRERS